MNRLGMISLACGLVALILLMTLSGVHMNFWLFVALFFVLTMIGLVCAVKAKQAIYLLIGGLLNGLLLIYTMLLAFAG